MSVEKVTTLKKLNDLFFARHIILVFKFTILEDLKITTARALLKIIHLDSKFSTRGSKAK